MVLGMDFAMTFSIQRRAWDTQAPGTRDAEQDDALVGIRCPRCAWRPSRSSRWCCFHTAGSPEPVFQSCLTVWNTFLTRGCCPGCSHQWQWTSCLRCAGWSRHEDWYEEQRPDPGRR
jgi:hypothetical protein